MDRHDEVTDDILDFFTEEFDFANEDFTFDEITDTIGILNSDEKDGDNVSDDLTVSTGDPPEYQYYQNQCIPKTSTPIQTLTSYQQQMYTLTPLQSMQSSLHPAATSTAATATATTAAMNKSNNIKGKRKYSKILKVKNQLITASAVPTATTTTTYDDFITEQTKRDKKFQKGEAGIPRPVTGYIKNVYAQMYMNSINSADFNHIQNYFSTFMSGPCSFTVQHQLSTGQYDLPHILNSFSPQLFSHYLLGCYLNFPDMVVKMKGARMYNATNGHTKIVIDVDVFCTKMFEVNFDWAPDVDKLSDLYSNMRVTYENTGSDNRSSNSSSSGSECGQQNRDRTAQLTGVVAPTASNLAAVRRLPQIPTAYVNNMTNQSKMLATPIPLHTAGTMTLYLDQNNCMKHVHINTAQVDDTSCTVPITVTSSAAVSASHSSDGGQLQLRQQQLQELQKWQSWKQQQPLLPHLQQQQPLQAPLPPPPAQSKPSPAPRKRSKKANPLPHQHK